jgi:hypothetical protein
MHDPREPHLAATKRIQRYLQGNLELSHHLFRTAPIDLVVYSDVDWASCPDTRRSTSGYGMFLCDNLIAWSSKRQQTISRSSVEAEYRVLIMMSPRLVGCGNCFSNFIVHCVVPPSSIATISVSFTSHHPPSSTSKQNMLRLIYTSFETASPLVKSTSFTFL